jgi:magnesium transporter
MISIFHKTPKAKAVQTLLEFKPNSWVYVENPSDEELQNLASKFYLEPSLLHDALDEYEVPRVEVENGILYIYMRIITANEGISITTPFLFIVRDGYLITVSRKALPEIQKYLDGRISFNTLDRSLLLIQLMNRILSQYKIELNSLSKKINSFSAKIEKINNKDIIQFVSFENNLSELNSSLIRMENIFSTIHLRKLIPLTEAQMDLVEDLMLEAGQQMQITKDSTRNIVNIREAYSTIMTNNLNHVITIFTSLTVILTIPTIIGSFFGMNVPVPFADNPYAFYGIIIVTFTLSVGAILYFLNRHWR